MDWSRQWQPGKFTPLFFPSSFFSRYSLLPSPPPSQSLPSLSSPFSLFPFLSFLPFPSLSLSPRNYVPDLFFPSIKSCRRMFLRRLRSMRRHLCKREWRRIKRRRGRGRLHLFHHHNCILLKMSQSMHASQK